MNVWEKKLNLKDLKEMSIDSSVVKSDTIKFKQENLVK